jgi:hypothetical protein
MTRPRRRGAGNHDCGAGRAGERVREVSGSAEFERGERWLISALTAACSRPRPCSRLCRPPASDFWRPESNRGDQNHQRQAVSQPGGGKTHRQVDGAAFMFGKSSGHGGRPYQRPHGSSIHGVGLGRCSCEYSLTNNRIKS